MLGRFGNATDALTALPDIANLFGKGRRIELPFLSDIEHEITATHSLPARLIASCEPDFPKLLVSMNPPPPLLTVMGNLAIVGPDAVAIVGARNESAAGRKIAPDMAAELGRARLTTVFYPALGIDSEAHAASLKTVTVAVRGDGIDHIYPPQHERLFREIADQGLIVSESPTGYKACAQGFPRRTRIITAPRPGHGLGRGRRAVRLVHLGPMAGDQGRDVMAVPGLPVDPCAAGTNGLVCKAPRRCAMRRTCWKGWQACLRCMSPPRPRPPSRRISWTARCRRTSSPAYAGLNSAQCQEVLMELELAGETLSYPGGLVARAV